MKWCRVLLPVVLMALPVSWNCNCGDNKLVHQTCETDPRLCPDAGNPTDKPDAGEPDAGEPLPGDPGQTCSFGSVSGRVCAPDQQTWVNGATVSIDATDCNGQPVHVSTLSGADGSFSLDGIPPGQQTVHASLGAFTQDTQVTVTANQNTAIPDNQLCVQQKTVKIAVITGNGDKIETLLDSLTLTYTLFKGDSTSYASGAAPFLSNLSQMQQFDLIFIDCGAAKSSSSSNIDFGSNAVQIEKNLHDYVAQGGSLYSSDWALLFADYAQLGKLDFLLITGGTVVDPLNTKNLMGYAPQTVTANIQDQELATFLGKTQVSITFPDQSGAVSLHWGLMQNVASDVRILIEAPSVQTCETTNNNCTSAGGSATNIPLAVEFKLTPAGARGGHVVYTSFHNIAQTGTDVANILKFVVLHL